MERSSRAVLADVEVILKDNLSAGSAAIPLMIVLFFVVVKVLISRVSHSSTLLHSRQSGA